MPPFTPVTPTSAVATAPSYNLAAVLYEEHARDREPCDEGPRRASLLSQAHGNSEVIGVVGDDELFLTYRQRGNYQLIRTTDGREGYLDASLIRVLSNGAELARQLGTPATHAGT